MASSDSSGRPTDRRDTAPVTHRPYETNVCVPVCAAVALDVIAASHRTSRDGALRSLLVTYAERQRELSEDERLTHIATLMRYPLHRRKRGLLADPDVNGHQELPGGGHEICPLVVVRTAR